MILFQKFAGNLRLPEAVGPVHVLNGADVFLQQSLAVTPVTDHAPARLTEHRSAHQFCFEELISRNADGCELVAIAWRDGIQHTKALAFQHAALAYADSCAKVAERLEVVLQVPAAFIEKVRPIDVGR